jgi:hypothetical protein
MDKECLQQVKDFKYVGCEISYKKRKNMQHKLATCVPNTGNFNHFKPIWIHKSSKKKLYSL